MKKIFLGIIAILLLDVGLFGQTTPNLGLNIPPFGTQNWNTPINANFSKLDILLAPYGTATIAGTLVYFNGTNWVSVNGNTSGTNVLQEDANGNPSWVPNGGGGGGSVVSVTGTDNQIKVTGIATPVVSIPSNFTFPGTVTNNLSIFGPTTSAQLKSLLTDETGSGAAVFSTSPTFVTPNLGVATASGLTMSAGNIDSASVPVVQEVPNAASGGTTVNSLAKISTTGAVKTLTTDTGIPAFIVVGGAGTAGNALLAQGGQAQCTMDATNASGVQGQPVFASSTAAGDCSTAPTAGSGVWIVGTLLSNSTSVGNPSPVMVSGLYVTASSSSGSAGGDLSGTYPNPAVQKVTTTACALSGAFITGSSCYANEQAAMSAAAGGLAQTPQTYSGSDVPNGTRLTSINTPTLSTQTAQTHLFDYRFGGLAESLFNPAGDQLSGLLAPRQLIVNWTNTQFGKQAVTTPGYADIFGLYIQQNILFGTQNWNQNGYVNKNNFEPLTITQNQYSPLQGIGLGVGVNGYSQGDALALAIGSHCFGGTNAGSDESCEAIDADISQGYITYLGTISGNPAPGALSATVAPTQGQKTQGIGRWLLDLTQAVTTGSVTSVTGTGLVAVVFSGTSLGTSTATTTSAAITVPGGATTPGSVNIQVGSSAGFSTSSLSCVADANSFETVIPSAVPDGTHITANFTQPHLSGATIATGGACGTFFELDADRYNTGGTVGFVGVTPPLREVWPFVTSSSNTAATVWVSSSGTASSFAGTAATFPGAAYHQYPGAIVSDIRNGGDTVSDTLGLAPNSADFASGDSVEVALYPTVKIRFGNIQLNTFFWQNTNVSGISYNGHVGVNTTGWGITNNTPANLYTGHGGNAAPPNRGFRLTGDWNYGIWADNFPDSILIYADCPYNSSGTKDCTVNSDKIVLGMQGNSQDDTLTHNPSTGTYKFNIPSATFTFATAGFTAPGLTVSGISGSTQCLHASTTGVVTGTGSDCGAGGGFANPMTTLGDIIYENATPAAARLAGPTGVNSVPQVLTSTPSGGLATAPAWTVTGVSPNAQTGTSYTIAATDRGGYVSLSNASAVAVTLPQAGTTGFASNFVFVTCDIGAGTATITPTTSTISVSTGTGYTAGASSLALTTGQCASIYSDNTNYSAILRAGSSGSVSSFSAGNLSPLFTTSVATATSTPALTFALSNAAANTVFGNATSGSAAPGFTSSPIVTSIGTGTPPSCTPGTGGVYCAGEGTAPTGAASVDMLYADSTLHGFKAIINNTNAHKIFYGELGSCSMSAATTCTFSAGASFSGTPICFATIQASPPATANVASCAISGTTVTITAGASNSLTWNALLVGNPD